jgi:hypothetical protein
MKRFLIALIGGTILLLGVAMVILPGPAIVVIPAGLAILATEFIWAKRWLAKGKRILHRWKIARAAGLSRCGALKRAFSWRSRQKSPTLH